MKKRLFNKRGMTYVELLVALALLALIIVSFTPMLVSSYETLYKAGEKTEEVYDSQQEIERGLAVRSSTRQGTVAMSFKMNAQNVFETMNVNGRKVVSTLQDKLETIFYGVRARIDIITPNVVYDDTLTHDVVLQTTGIPFTDVKKRSEYTGNLEDMPKDVILIDAFIPDKHTGSEGTTTDEVVYRNNRASLDITEKNATTGRISFTVGGADFTLSPIKIVIYYKNERGIPKTLSDYLYIEPPTILMAGTNINDYYTSAGIEEKTAVAEDGSQSTEYTLIVQPRTMRIENSPYLKKYFGTPTQTQTVIRNITWVDTDEDSNIAPYYVMVGTNGAMYRMYNYNNHTSDIYKLSIGNTSRPNVSGYGQTDGLTGWDNTFETEDGYRVCASLWSGDSSHVFDFSSWWKSMNYGLDEEGGNDNCWLTAEQYTAKEGTSIVGIKIGKDTIVNTNKGADKYNLFGMQAKFSYYLNGYRVGFNYAYQKARNMSYIITEHGAPLRVLGHLKNESDYSGFTENWYPSGTYTTFGWKDSNSDVNTICLFTGSSGVDGQGYRHGETAFSAIRFTNFGSYNPNVDTLVNFMRTDGDATDNREQARQITEGYESLKGLESEINLTDAIYIPTAGNVKGSMLYLGTVHAYMNVMQKDNISTTQNFSLKVVNRSENKDFDWDEYVAHGALTDYVIFGNAQGTGTSVHKYSSNAIGRHYVKHTLFGASESGVDWDKTSTNGVSAAEKQQKMQTEAANRRVGDHRRYFFVTRENGWKDMFMEDVLFTMGYSSNREKVFTNITYDGQREYYRSYEHFYFQSHYGVGGVNTDGSPNKVATRATVGNSANRNIYNNDYYNVWFPGEMYNLTQVASEEGITVAVGYAVAGSAYQWINPNQTTNTSTALGGIYNDGVLAAMVEGTQSAFTNLLYFKDNRSFNSNYLTTTHGGAEYRNAFGTYGTHERDSVQFTAVDINSEIIYNGSATSGSASGTKHYYAYYGDNKGRVFKSLVATSQVTVTSSNDEKIEMTENTNLVSFIADDTYAGTAAAPSQMQEIKLDDSTPLSQYFSKIVSIEADNDMVIISGSGSDGKLAVVVGVKSDNSWSWKRVQLTGHAGLAIYSAKTIGDYYYFAGTNFFAGVSLDALKKAANNTIIVDNQTNVGEKSTSTVPNAVMWVGTADYIYAMDGRDTR